MCCLQEVHFPSILYLQLKRAQGQVKLILSLIHKMVFHLVSHLINNNGFLISLLSGNSELIEPLQPGSYNTTVSVDAKPDPNCDPTQDICENWLPGNYSVVVCKFYI